MSCVRNAATVCCVLRGFLGNFVKILWEHINRSFLWRLKRPYTPLVRPGCNCIPRGRKPSILLRSLRSNASWAHGCANMQESATCCWPTSEPASARARNERAPRRLYHISMAKSSIFFTQNLEKLLDFPQIPITDSKLKITRTFCYINVDTHAKSALYFFHG